MPEPVVEPLASLAVLVVNFGTHDLVEANLTRSLGTDFPGHIIVIDNYSDEQERRAISKVCERRGWTCVAVDSNDGFGGGNNRGGAEAIELGATELLLVNPDAWLALDDVRRLHEQVIADPMLLLAPRVVRPNGRLYSDANDLYLHQGETLWTHLRPEDADPSRIHTFVSGACLMTSTTLWSLCGGFDEDYFLYWEDVDLCRRVVQAGGRVAVDDALTAVHDEGSSHGVKDGSDLKSPTYFYYNTRNRLVYAAKHLDRGDQNRWLRATPRASYRIAKQGGRSQFRRPSRNLWPALRGTWHGIRFLRRSRRASS